MSTDDTTAPPPQRLLSLDAFRGLIMLTLMSSGVFSSLNGLTQTDWLRWHTGHAAWETTPLQSGVAYWDLIQPCFMFMAGVSMPFALAKRAGDGASQGRLFLHVLIRALNLMLVGIVLDHLGASSIQPGIIRVLQQIAIGYVLAFFAVGRSWRAQWLAAAGILTGYTLLWMFNPWNGSAGPWAMGNVNIGSAFDHWARGKFYSGYYVGMNAIPATATIIFGVMAGTLIQQQQPKGRTLALLAAYGLAGVALGAAVSPWLPLIKRLWTPSWAIFSGGCAALILAAFYLIIEIWNLRRWAFPLTVVGMNSIAAYCFRDLFYGWWERLSGVWVKWAGDTLLPWPAGSAGRALSEQCLFLGFAWWVLYWLWRRRIFLKC